tara:strand:+ start:187 stop:576 length:390 start_codon:yes stop_codon:yes gene_type:complete
MIQLNLYSYGCNIGSYEIYPDDSIIYDVRHVHINEVKTPREVNHTGLDKTFRKSLFQNSNLSYLLETYINDIQKLINNGASQNTINIVVISDTGQHRSVSIVEELYLFFNKINSKNIYVNKKHLSMNPS